MPETQESLLNKILHAFQTRAFETANRLSNQLLEQFPQSPALEICRAQFAFLQGNLITGTQLLRKATNRAEALTLAFPLLQQALQQHELNLPLVKLLEQDASPKAASQAIEYAGLYLATGNIQKAIELLQNDALFADSPSVNRALYTGHAFKALADTSAAANQYHHFINQKDADPGIGYWSLADLKQYQFSPADVKHMKALLENNPPIKQRGLIEMALSRYFEQQNDMASAAHYLLQGNQHLASTRQFSVAQFEHTIDTISRWQPVLNSENKSTPVFIVGPPRSGTTLTEQILAAHPDLAATDELPFVERLAIQLSSMGPYPHILNSLPPTIKNTLCTFYSSQVKDYAPTFTGSFIDKNPGNFLHIGLIKALFPAARICAISRPVGDTVISLLKQHFSRGNDYAYSIDNILTYLLGFYRVMTHWKQCFGQDIKLLKYEDLVHQPDSTIGSLLEYCGLSENHACYHFYQSEQPVLTPSASQVRQPIHTNNLNSSQPYAHLLKPYQEAILRIERLRDSLYDNI